MIIRYHTINEYQDEVSRMYKANNSLKQRISELEEQLATANEEIKDLKQRLKIASDANEHIMEYVKELEFDANSTFQTTTR